MGPRRTGTVSSVREAHVPLRSDSRGVSWASLIGFWWASLPLSLKLGMGGCHKNVTLGRPPAGKSSPEPQSLFGGLDLRYSRGSSAGECFPLDASVVTVIVALISTCYLPS